MTTPLTAHTGAWTGMNSFRLMPSDLPYEAAFTADVSLGAKDAMAVVAYAWNHPDDGEQNGLLVIGQGDSPSEILALWCDSWHQSPASKVVTGTVDNGLVTVGYAYGDGEWQWQIVLDARDPDALRIRMDNVVPASAAAEDGPAGAYSAMLTELTRD